jgi:hypothetical protein
MAFPCESMARASSSVGIHYTSVFLLVAFVYGGGIACFGASAAVQHSLFRFSTGGAVLAGWILNMMAPVASDVCLSYGVAFLTLYTDDEVSNTKSDVSATSMALVGIHFSCQIVFLAIVLYLRRNILKRSHALSCCSSWPGSFCFTLCFPCCSFAETMQRARATQKYQVHRVQADQLPAYVA